MMTYIPKFVDRGDESAVNFKEKYNDSGFTTEVVTDYPEKLAMLDEANKSIQQLREDNNNYRDREQFYQKLNPYLDKLSKMLSI
jgi:cell shape-determining protein MreC